MPDDCNNWVRRVLLQCKFFLVAWLNCTYVLIPNPIRNWYFRCFGIKIGKNSCIHRKCKFFHVGNLVVGDNCVINFGSYLDNRRGIIIGNNVGIAHNAKIYTLGHNIDSPKFETRGASVVIEDNVFIFSNSLVMPGVRIGEGAVVLAGSVVTKSVDPWMIVGGNPARVIKMRQKVISYKSEYMYWFAL